METGSGPPVSHKEANPEQKSWHPNLQPSARFPGLWKDRLHGTLNVTDSPLSHTDLELGRDSQTEGEEVGARGTGGEKKGEKGTWRGNQPESLVQCG